MVTRGTDTALGAGPPGRADEGAKGAEGAEGADYGRGPVMCSGRFANHSMTAVSYRMPKSSVALAHGSWQPARSAAAQELLRFWPMWVIGPWGLVILLGMLHGRRS